MANNMVRDFLGLPEDGISSEEEEIATIVSRIMGPNKRRGGFVLGHRVINRNRQMGHIRLYNDYFTDQSVYSNELFRRRFRMMKRLFLRILQKIKVYDEYFEHKINVAGVVGCSSLQKMTAAVCFVMEDQRMD
eukprot:XP_008680097.1 uncharacterized protein LOC103655065 [Zea mays]